jgi:soluble lytic murein transglycosylase-like protein
VRFLLYVLAIGEMAAAQNTQTGAIRAAMDASLSKQRASIARQAQSAIHVSGETRGDSFFWAPWPKPAGVQTFTADCAPLGRDEVDRLASEAARAEDVSVDLVRAVMRRESGFRPCAVSARGAQGLMQLMPATAADLRVSDPFDARQNVAAGVRFLKQLIDKYGGDLERALGAYNAGPGRVDRSGGVPLIPETRNYVSDILDRVSVD